MKKKDLKNITGLSTVSIAKIGKNENVSVNALEKICEALNCDIADIIEYINEKEEN